MESSASINRITHLNMLCRCDHFFILIFNIFVLRHFFIDVIIIVSLTILLNFSFFFCRWFQTVSFTNPPQIHHHRRCAFVLSSTSSSSFCFSSILTNSYSFFSFSPTNSCTIFFSCTHEFSYVLFFFCLSHPRNLVKTFIFLTLTNFRKIFFFVSYT